MSWCSDMNPRQLCCISAFLLLVASGCGGDSGSDYVRDGDHLYLNTAAEVAYVGSDACRDCHLELYQSFMKTTTAHSMVRLDSSNIIESYPQINPVYDPGQDFYYEMIQRGNRFFQREYRLDLTGEIIHERIMEAHYAIGSGKNLRMYFHDENGMFYELPLTWYVHRGEWDLSPGYREFGNLRFSRFAGSKCLACHNDHMKVSPIAYERFLKPYPLGIGCEACHGPGDLHIRQERGETIDLPSDDARTIVNPVDLSPRRQIDVCQQCHLQGKGWALWEGVGWFDFRPGMLLEDRWSVFTDSKTKREAFKVANSAYRFAQSRCFKESHGVTTCNTCHDSHGTFKGSSIEFNRQNCQKCHPPESLPGKGSRFAHGPNDNCVPCHMKQTGTENTLHGVINTDHWIRVDADSTHIDWTSYRTPFERQGLVSLSPFLDAGDSSRFQRRGVAWIDYFRNYDNQAPYLDSAMRYLEYDIQLRGGTPRTFYYLGDLQHERGEYRKAQTALQKALRLKERYPEAWFRLGQTYAALGRNDSAASCYRTAVGLLPGEPAYFESLGITLAEQGSVPAAIDTLKEALRLDRYNPAVYAYLGNIYALSLDQPALALPFLRERAVLDPDNPDAYVNLGNVYLMLGQYDKAIDTYALELYYRPGSLMALYNLARAYDLSGAPEKAEDARARAMAINPSMIGAIRP